VDGGISPSSGSNKSWGIFDHFAKTLDAKKSRKSGGLMLKSQEKRVFLML